MDRRHGMPCEPELLPSGRILNVLVFELASVMEVGVYLQLATWCPKSKDRPWDIQDALLQKQARSREEDVRPMQQAG